MLGLYEQQKQKELKENPEAEPVKVGRYSLELSAIGCVFIASKFDELDNNIPFLKDFIKAAKFMFKYDEIIQEEKRLCEKFDWQLLVVSPLHFVYSLLSMGVVFEDDKYKNEKGELREMDQEQLKKMRKGTEFFSDLSAKDYELLQFKPSVVAAATILASRRVNRIHPQRNPRLSHLFGFDVNSPQLLKAYRRLIVFYQDTCDIPEEDLGNSFTQELQQLRSDFIKVTDSYKVSEGSTQGQPSCHEEDSASSEADKTQIQGLEEMQDEGKITDPSPYLDCTQEEKNYQTQPKIQEVITPRQVNSKNGKAFKNITNQGSRSS